GEAMARRQLPDAGVNRAVVRERLEGEEIGDRGQVDLRSEARNERERPAFRAEGQPIAALPIEERLLAKRVARAEELVRAAIVDRERKHPVEPVEHCAPPMPI